MYRIAYCYVKNEHEALDITSQAIYKGYISFGNLKSNDRFDAWITRITINCALSHLKSKKRVVYLDQLEHYPTKDNALKIEEKLDLYDALNKLEPEEKSYIILKFFLDMRFRDMAEVLSLSENTVKTRYYRVINKLKNFLNDEEVFKL